MWLQFFSQNFHFAVNLLAGLACLGVCWLYFDAWTNRKALKELIKWIGFMVLGLGFLFQATIIEQSVLGSSLLGDWSNNLATITKLAGYILTILGQILDPLQINPKNEGLKLHAEPIKPPSSSKTSPAMIGALGTASKWALPLGGLAVAGLFWRRATAGLERHLKSVAKAFLFFGLADFLAVAGLLRDTSNPVFFSWVAAFGWIWWLQQMALLVGVVLLGRWVWGYLTERFFSQLFMIFTTMVVLIFLVVSVGFTGLLIRNIQDDSLANLETAANVLDYALQSKQSEASSAAQQLAGSSDVISGIVSKNRDTLIKAVTDFLVNKRLSSLIITNQSGQVFLRAEDVDRWGDSLSNDTLIKRALLGLGQSTISTSEGVGSPIVQIRSAAVVVDSSNSIVGSVTASIDLGPAFVDGIKDSTGLQSSVYASDTMAATTLVAPNGKTRTVGVRLSDQRIKDQVLNQANSYKGVVSLQNRQMLGVFLPVKDVDNGVVGMLMIAKPRSSILLTAGRSVELTFLLATLLLILSFIPTFFVSRSLSRQLE